MGPDLLAELRDLADLGSAAARQRIAALSPEQRAEVLFQLLTIDAARRAADALADEPHELPAGGPEALADVLDYAKTLSDNIEAIDSIAGVINAAFAGLSTAEAHLLAAERGLRALVERKRGAP